MHLLQRKQNKKTLKTTCSLGSSSLWLISHVCVHLLIAFLLQNPIPHWLCWWWLLDTANQSSSKSTEQRRGDPHNTSSSSSLWGYRRIALAFHSFIVSFFFLFLFFFSIKAESLNFIVLKPNLSVLWLWLTTGQHQLASSGLAACLNVSYILK